MSKRAPVAVHGSFRVMLSYTSIDFCSYMSRDELSFKNRSFKNDSEMGLIYLAVRDDTQE